MPVGLVPLLLVLFAPPRGQVEIDGATFAPLVVDEEEAVEETNPPWALDRRVEIRPVEGGFRVSARFEVRAIEPGWLDQVLIAAEEVHVESFGWTGGSASLHAEESVGRGAGARVTVPVDRGGVLEMVAFVRANGAGELEMAMMPAVRGTIEIAAGELVPRFVDGEVEAPLIARGAKGRFLYAESLVHLVLEAPREEVASSETMAVSHTGVGLTVGEGELRGAAKVVYEIRRGELGKVVLDVKGVGKDLVLTGPNVRGFTRDGDRIAVELREPARARVDLELRWSDDLRKREKIGVPTIEPQGAFRSDASVQLARDSDIEIVPTLAAEWNAVAGSDLPEWGRGLVDGTPTAAFVGAALSGGTLEVLRFDPVEAPPVVIDVADYEIATTREGRAVVRARLQLRNERASHLHVRLPAGMRLLGVRVAGESTAPSLGEGGEHRIPLKRSVETVDGLLSFAVELALVGEATPFRARDRRQFPLPIFTAEVAVSRATLFLPPAWENQQKAGKGHVVDRFSEGEGITYGFGTDDERTEVADEMFGRAVDRWLENDFRGAQEELDQLRDLGADNEDMKRLQANIDLIEGKSDKGDEIVTRRIREQAKARSFEDVQQQAAKHEEAERLRVAGRYDEAKEKYAEAIDIGERLAKLEQRESVEQSQKNISIEGGLAELEKEEASAERRRRFVNARSGGGKKLKTKDGRNEDDDIGGKRKACRVGPDGECVYASKQRQEAESKKPADGEPSDETVATGRITTTFGDSGDTDEDGAAEGEEAAEPMEAPESEEPVVYHFDDELDASGAMTGEVLGGPDVASTPAQPEPDVGYTTEGANATTPAPPADAPRYERARDISRRSPAKVISARGLPGRASGRAGAGAMAKKGKRSPMGSKKDMAQSPEAPPAAMPVGGAVAGPMVADPNADDMPAIEVNASSLSVVIPKIGRVVRYQHLLLPAGATPELEIRAKAPRNRTVHE